jgi:hypothetical protein
MLTMPQDFQLIQRPEIELEVLTIHEIEKVIDKTTPFKGRCAKESDISDYLKQVNDLLFDRKIDRHELRHHHITASSIYIFLKHLLNLTTLDTVESNFKFILSRKPYEVDRPLELFYKPANEEGIEEIEHSKLIYVPDRTEFEDLKFKRSETYIMQIEQEARKTAGILRQLYAKSIHFSFLGYTRVACPLFNLKVCKNSDIILLDHKLETQHGSFVMKVPEYLCEGIVHQQ